MEKPQAPSFPIKHFIYLSRLSHFSHHAHMFNLFKLTISYYF